MKKILLKIIYPLVFFIGNIIFALPANSNELDKDEIDKIVSHLRSKDENTQFKGFKKITTMGKNGFQIIQEYRTIPEIKNGMFDLFVQYSSNPNPKSKLIFCGDVSTFNCLLNVIGDFNDLRTLPYLLKNIRNGITKRSLAQLGKHSLDPVIEKLKNGDSFEKINAADILGLMLEEKEEGFTAQNKDRERIKQELLKSLDDKENSKIIVVQSLGKLKDINLLPLFEKIKKNDSTVLDRKNSNGNSYKWYPVREEASKAIDLIREK